MKTDGHIELSSGRNFPFELPWQWHVDEIAHALGNQCRYTGHCREFYSVAEHSCLAALLAEETGWCDPFEALMHDAHESLMGDMARPWKPLVSGYAGVELSLESDMRQHFGLPAEPTPGCKRVDYHALFIEAHSLMKSRGEGWEDPYEVRPVAYRLREQGWKVRCLTPKDARNTFIRSYNELQTVPAEYKTSGR